MNKVLKVQKKLLCSLLVLILLISSLTGLSFGAAAAETRVPETSAFDTALARTGADDELAEIGAEPDIAKIGEAYISQDEKWAYYTLSDGTIAIYRYRIKKLRPENFFFAIPSVIDGYRVSWVYNKTFMYSELVDMDNIIFFVPAGVQLEGRGTLSFWNSYRIQTWQSPTIVLYEGKSPDFEYGDGKRREYPLYEYHLLEDGTAMLDVIRPWGFSGTQTIPKYLWDGTEVSAIAPNAFQPILVDDDFDPEITFGLYFDEISHIYKNGYKTHKRYDNNIIVEPVLDTVPNDMLNGLSCKSVTLNITADTQLDQEAFHGCGGALNLNLIGDRSPKAFEFCENIDSDYNHINLTIGGSIDSIDDYAFGIVSNADLHAIKSVTIKGNVKNIGKYAFLNQYEMKTLTLEDGVQTIGDEAFYGCTNLYSVTIPPSVTEIGTVALGFRTYTNGLSPADPDYYSGTVKLNGFTIYGVKGTEAEKYAKRYQFRFVEIEPDMTSINGLRVTLAEPKAGETPDFSAAVPEGKGYAIDPEGGVMWFNVSDDDVYIAPDSDYVFEPYKEYRVMITLVTTDDDYKFAAANRRATLNDMNVVFSDYGWNEEHMVYIESTFFCGPEGWTGIGEVSVYTDDPPVGSTPYYYAITGSDMYRVTDGLDDADQYITGGIGWYNETDGCVMGYTDRFEEGKVYQWSVRLSSNEFAFAPASEIKATLNGKTADVQRLSDRTIVLTYYFAMPGSMQTTGFLGDTDGDGEVEIRDATWIQRRVAAMDLPFTFSKPRADVDGDGEITVMDSTAIQYYLAQMKTPYNIGRLLI